MAHQIQRYSAPAERAWAWGDGYRAGRHGRSRTDQQNAPTQPSVTATAASFDEQVRQTANLQVTTDDGDKVTISFAALRQLHAESVQGQSGNASIDYGSASSSDKVSVGVTVDGSLDDKEVADIGKLLQQLTTSVHDPSQGVAASQLQDGGSFASLDSFQFAYREQIRAAYSQSQVASTGG